MPSLALIRQLLNTWSCQAIAEKLEFEYIAVCSDQDVGEIDDPLMNSHDLGISVTTNANKVSNFLNTKNDKLKVLLTTYQSGEVVIAATKITYEFELGAMRHIKLQGTK